MLSRLIYGTRIALIVAFVAATLAALLGTAARPVRRLSSAARSTPSISRLVDIWMSFPPVLLSILLVAVIGAGVGSVIAAIAIIDWTRFCRVVRAETMAQASRTTWPPRACSASAARASCSAKSCPTSLPLLLALLTLEMGIAVIVEAILSFVGLSVSSDTPTWGGMIAQGRQIIHQAWWVFAAPLAALFATVLAFNQLGDGLRRALDPVMRR